MILSVPPQELIKDIVYFGGSRTKSGPCEPLHLEPCKITAIFVAIYKASNDVALKECPHTGFPHFACLIDPDFLSENGISQCPNCTGCNSCEALERDSTSGAEEHNVDANGRMPQLIRAVRDAGELWAATLYIACDSLVTKYDDFLKDCDYDAGRLCKVTRYVKNEVDKQLYNKICEHCKSVYLALNDEQRGRNVLLREYNQKFSSYWKTRIRHLNQMNVYSRSSK